MARVPEGIDKETRRELGGGVNGSDGAWGNVMGAWWWRRMDGARGGVECGSSGFRTKGMGELGANKSDGSSGARHNQTNERR
ncbi:unnamed protein product [Calypogeia fissa]